MQLEFYHVAPRTQSDKGALTPKSFANIVRSNLNLSFYKIKLVSKDQSVSKQKNGVTKMAKV